MSSITTSDLELHSEINRLSKELDLSETRFRDIIERNADAIVVVDHEGLVRFANRPAKNLFGGRDKLTGQPFGFPLVAGETTEVDLVRDQHVIAVEMRVVETQWEGEDACIATLRDVTERKRAEHHERDLIRAHAAQVAAEGSARKFRFLADSSSLLSSSLDYAGTLSQLARLCVPELADWVVVYTCEGKRLQRLEVAHRDESKADLVRRLKDAPMEPTARHPVFELMRTRRPQLINHADRAAMATSLEDGDHRELVAQLGISSLMLVPMIARERILGAIALVSSSADRLFNQQDLALAGDLAARAALAVDNARLYEDARRANQVKTELLAVISHDLRTPLNSIIGYGQLLQMGIPDPLTDGTRERIDRMLTSARHQLYLIDELLHFARLESRHEDLQLESIDACAVAREAATLIEPLAAQRGLAFNVSTPAGRLAFATDPDKLRQILLNLLSNAVKYTEHGSVSLTVRKDDDDLVFQVIDTGIGIAPEHLPHVFEPFWQVDRGQRTRGGGTGLGLSVVRQVTELLGGNVVVSSTRGTGSTFTVRLRRT